MDLKDLYRDVIVDHNRAPRNFRKIAGADKVLEGFNPLCGDKLTVYLKMDGDMIRDLSFEGSGCAISVASASLMTERLKGKTRSDADELFNQMHDLLTRSTAPEDVEALGKLAALAGVREYPSRVKCAILCWHTLKGALHGDAASVSTE
ncbi:MAG TPA: SUF system NifU family Fe-S cluster assembly protein [Gammaproteobacteria bacterium]|jgi:nitrogen fixation NifU-like protein|nr:SUF system NifU family Fe-S cluster assembly protein [Gammaproteobacteria bacterium]